MILVVAVLVAAYSVFMLASGASPPMWGTIPLGLLGLVAAVALAAGALLVLLCAASATVVFRHFRRAR